MYLSLSLPTDTNLHGASHQNSNALSKLAKRQQPHRPVLLESKYRFIICTPLRVKPSSSSPQAKDDRINYSASPPLLCQKGPSYCSVITNYIWASRMALAQKESHLLLERLADIINYCRNTALRSCS